MIPVPFEGSSHDAAVNAAATRRTFVKRFSNLISFLVKNGDEGLRKPLRLHIFINID
jgi:hypothetical protein